MNPVIVQIKEVISQGDINIQRHWGDVVCGLERRAVCSVPGSRMI
jgi:hypothetical protein